MRRKSAEIIDVSIEKLEGIKSHVSPAGFLKEEKKIILAIIRPYSWLMSHSSS